MELKRKGICKNFGNCINADNKLPIELDLTADFICSECQQDLVEITQEPNPLKKLLIPGIAILVIGGLTWGVFTYINIQKNKVKDVVEIGQKIVDDNKLADNLLSENIAKLAKEADSFFENKDFENAKIAFKAILALDPENLHAKQFLMEIGKISELSTNAEPGKNIKGGKEKHEELQPPGKQSKNFENGDRYVGEMKNGKMQGLGTFYYNSDQIISEKDLKKRKALKGDYLIGEWYEGRVVSGKLYDSNNSQKEVVIIGR